VHLVRVQQVLVVPKVLQVGAAVPGTRRTHLAHQVHLTHLSHAHPVHLAHLSYLFIARE
jgi:hypothetical protein